MATSADDTDVLTVDVDVLLAVVGVELSVFVGVRVCAAQPSLRSVRAASAAAAEVPVRCHVRGAADAQPVDADVAWV